MTISDQPDLRSPEFIADPFPVLAELRRRDPVHWNSSLGGWVLTRHDDVRDGLRDKRLSADRIRPFLDHLKDADRARIAELGDTLRMWAVFTDPPVHTRLRGLMNKAFTTRAIDGLAPNIQAIVDDLLDRVAGQGRMDAIRDFAYPLPATVIADMLGVPRGDVESLKAWSDDLAAFVLTSRVNPDRYRVAAESMREMVAYFEDLVALRRREPGDDVMSGLIAAHEAGDRLSVAELVANTILMLFAGHETTTHLIGNGLLALLRHPEQLARLKAHRHDRSVVRNAVEEILRFDGPTLASVRVVDRRFEIDGKTLTPGERVFLFNAAANRDPAVFPEPDRFAIDRPEAGRNVAFGYGLHFCIGAPLARLEGEIAFATLLDRLDDLALVQSTPDWSDTLNVRGVHALEVTFTPAAKTA
jgi:cytochrome P450